VQQQKEVIMDMAANMQLVIKRRFTKAKRLIDRFTVQKLVYYDVLQEKVPLKQ